MASRSGIAVIFWGPHSDTTERFARRLNAPLYLIHYLKWRCPPLAPIKYIPMWFKTWSVLRRQRPSAVFVVNTPVFAPLCIYAYCRIARVPYVMNIHGHSFTGPRWGWSRPLMATLARRALVNLVDFPAYWTLFDSWGARALILEDAPLEIPRTNRVFTTPPGDFQVTVISTFSGDEPLRLVVEAVRQLPQVRCSILGDTALADRQLIGSAPPNVRFPGYLKGDAYWHQLRASQALMTLTTNDDSLVAGGTDGMYLGKPLILSRQPVLVDYFHKGTVFVDHTVDSIADGMRQAQARAEALALESAELAVEKRNRWERTFQEFLSLLGDGHA